MHQPQWQAALNRATSPLLVDSLKTGPGPYRWFFITFKLYPNMQQIDYPWGYKHWCVCQNLKLKFLQICISQKIKTNNLWINIKPCSIQCSVLGILLSHGDSVAYIDRVRLKTPPQKFQVTHTLRFSYKNHPLNKEKLLKEAKVMFLWHQFEKHLQNANCKL